MVSNETFRKLSLSFADAEELPHFEKASFRVKKKIFATLSEEGRSANLKLTPLEQSVFIAFDKTIIYPVPNKWGQQGWTTVELAKVKKEMLVDILQVAYENVAKPKK